MLSTRLATPPRRPLPENACDCHVHICDGDRHPIREHAPYTPPDAPFESHRAMLDAVGLERSVTVQILAYGEDNDVISDALVKGHGAMRGIAALTANASDAELARLHAAGIRGLRFYFELPRPVTGVQAEGVGIDDLVALAPRMKALNWIAEISASCDRIVEYAPRLQSLGLPIVLEHMAGCTATMDIQNPRFQRMLGLLSTGGFWVKLTICRMSNCAPYFEDLRPVHDAFVSAAPGRMLWGSDWPHILMGESAPDIGHLIDVFDDWIDHDEGLRKAILSDNPALLFSF
jgi:2-pyrone-4,6-dicarboxylate lactonase